MKNNQKLYKNQFKINSNGNVLSALNNYQRNIVKDQK